MMKGQIEGLMKQAQQMQEKIEQAQEALSSAMVTGQAGAGLVQIEISCKHQVQQVNIDQSVLDDKEMLEDLIAAAINDSERKIEAKTKEVMGPATGGLNLPPGLKLPF